MLSLVNCHDKSLFPLLEQKLTSAHLPKKAEGTGELFLGVCLLPASVHYFFTFLSTLLAHSRNISKTNKARREQGASLLGRPPQATSAQRKLVRPAVAGEWFQSTIWFRQLIYQSQRITGCWFTAWAINIEHLSFQCHNISSIILW